MFIKEKFEEHFFEIAEAFLPYKGIFFDLGCNVGFCTFGLLKDLPNIQCHLFEANKELISLVKKSIKLHQDNFIKVNYSCVTMNSGKTKFHVTKKQSGQSHVAIDKEDGIYVQNIVLDNYCAENSLNEINFLKIDLEGNELAALKGAKSMLSKKKIAAIYLELIPENQKRYNIEIKDLLSYLENFGYQLFLFKEEDFGLFGNAPFESAFMNNKKITIASFHSSQYPENYSTDILAIPK